MGNEINMVFFGCIHLARQFRFGSVRWIQLIIAAIVETELSKLRFSDQMIDMKIAKTEKWMASNSNQGCKQENLENVLSVGSKSVFPRISSTLWESEIGK